MHWTSDDCPHCAASIPKQCLRPQFKDKWCELHYRMGLEAKRVLADLEDACPHCGALPAEQMFDWPGREQPFDDQCPECGAIHKKPLPPQYTGPEDPDIDW